MKRLQREIDEVNRLFDEWERRAALEEERRSAAKAFHDMCTNLEITLGEFEKHIVKVCKAPLPRDVEALQGLVVSHKEFESGVQGHEPEVNQVKNLYNEIPEKTPKEQAKLDKVLETWDRIWTFSSFYVERLKTVEITLTGLEEVTTVVNEFEQKLAAYDSMPSDMENLRKAHDDLMTLEAEIQEKQVIFHSFLIVSYNARVDFNILKLFGGLFWSPEGGQSQYSPARKIANMFVITSNGEDCYAAPSTKLRN